MAAKWRHWAVNRQGVGTRRLTVLWQFVHHVCSVRNPVQSDRLQTTRRRPLTSVEYHDAQWVYMCGARNAHASKRNFSSKERLARRCRSVAKLSPACTGKWLHIRGAQCAIMCIAGKSGNLQETEYQQNKHTASGGYTGGKIIQCCRG